MKIPLSLYIHIPWCIRKCPYCDFNSHETKQTIPEKLYVETLMQDLDTYLPKLSHKELVSIFFGGGTPSLFSATAIEKILSGVHQRFSLSSSTEITLEANPGTIEQKKFSDFRAAGINRLSLGIQSFQNEKLNSLGRIHNSETAQQAILQAKKAGFQNMNLDIMYGLPHQSIKEAIHDLHIAITNEPKHISWYQLTIEPNTYFYRYPPKLPHDTLTWEMQEQGQALLAEKGYVQYEVSAYSHLQHQCIHNKNYWEFGDYLGIGAGAHSKLSALNINKITRHAQVKLPRDYLDLKKKKTATHSELSEKDKIFEFMLNALRLSHGFSSKLFTERTGVLLEKIKPQLNEAVQKKWIVENDTHLCPTVLGKRFLNDIIQLFF